jgi:hypothetical protein
MASKTDIQAPEKPKTLLGAPQKLSGPSGGSSIFKSVFNFLLRSKGSFELP